MGHSKSGSSIIVANDSDLLKDSSRTINYINVWYKFGLSSSVQNSDRKESERYFYSTSSHALKEQYIVILINPLLNQQFKKRPQKKCITLAGLGEELICLVSKSNMAFKRGGKKTTLILQWFLFKVHAQHRNISNNLRKEAENCIAATNIKLTPKMLFVLQNKPTPTKPHICRTSQANSNSW